MSDKSILIRGGAVVLGRTVAETDVLVAGERIRAVGDLGSVGADEVVDAGGLLVFPGAVDTHVHFNDVFMGTVSVHDYYTGTLAAAFGGVTSIVDFSNQVPGGSLISTLEDKREEAAGNAIVDWGIHPVITEPTERTLDQIPLVVQRGAPTIKCYMTYRSDGLLIEDADLERIAVRLSRSGGMLMLHAEDNDTIEATVPRLVEAGDTAAIYHARSRPPEVEAKAIHRIVEMARNTKARFFVVHLASDSGLEAITAARAEGLDVTAETCTHYLVFTEAELERDDGVKWICSPALRDKTIQDALWNGLRAGHIAMVTSDDAAYSWKAKLYGADRFDRCPNGIPGIETRLHILYSEGVAKGRLSLQRFVDLIATSPAQLFGLAPRKGSLTPGSDADIVLFDPTAQWTMGVDTLHMGADWSAYEGIDIAGKIVRVYARGELIIDGDECVAERGRGRYLHRKLNPYPR